MDQDSRFEVVVSFSSIGVFREGPPDTFDFKVNIATCVLLFLGFVRHANANEEAFELVEEPE